MVIYLYLGKSFHLFVNKIYGKYELMTIFSLHKYPSSKNLPTYESKRTNCSSDLSLMSKFLYKMDKVDLSLLKMTLNETGFHFNCRC